MRFNPLKIASSRIRKRTLFSRQMFLQQDQIDIGDSVKHCWNNGNLPVTQLLIHLPGPMIDFVRIHSQFQQAVFPGIVFIVPDKSHAQSPPAGRRIDDQGMQHTDRVITGFIFPGSVSIHIHLDLVDDRGAENASVLFQDKQIITLSGGPGCIQGGIDFPLPANPRPARFFFGMNRGIYIGDPVQVRFRCLSYKHIPSPAEYCLKLQSEFSRFRLYLDTRFKFPRARRCTAHRSAWAPAAPRRAV